MRKMGAEMTPVQRDRLREQQTRYRRPSFWIQVALVFVLFFIPLVPSFRVMDMAAKIMIFTVVVASSDLILGYTGLLSFAHAMFFGIGAYVSGSNPKIDYAVEICDAVCEVWEPTPENKTIINLPSTVELATPNVYADQIEVFCRLFAHRDSAIISLHTHNDRGTGIAVCRSEYPTTRAFGGQQCGTLLPRRWP